MWLCLSNCCAATSTLADWLRSDTGLSVTKWPWASVDLNNSLRMSLDFVHLRADIGIEAHTCKF